MQVAEQFAANVGDDARAHKGHQRNTRAVRYPLAKGGEQHDNRPKAQNIKRCACALAEQKLQEVYGPNLDGIRFGRSNAIVNCATDEPGDGDAEERANGHKNDGGD